MVEKNCCAGAEFLNLFPYQIHAVCYASVLKRAVFRPQWILLVGWQGQFFAELLFKCLFTCRTAAVVEGRDRVEEDSVHLIHCQNLPEQRKHVLFQRAAENTHSDIMVFDIGKDSRCGFMPPFRFPPSQLSVHAEIDIGNGPHFTLMERLRHLSRKIHFQLRMNESDFRGIEAETRVILCENHGFRHSRAESGFHRALNIRLFSDSRCRTALHTVAPCRRFH